MENAALQVGTWNGDVTCTEEVTSPTPPARSLYTDRAESTAPEVAWFTEDSAPEAASCREEAAPEAASCRVEAASDMEAPRPSAAAEAASKAALL